VPLRFGTSRGEYHDRFVQALQSAADIIKPELVLVSAGFDAHRLDPIGNLGLDGEDFADLTKRVFDIARTHAGGRLVSCLEGGYHWQATADSVRAHLEQLLAVAGQAGGQDG
jgi:acetoin utilization deacetylase AcuC-like enzyme